MHMRKHLRVQMMMQGAMLLPSRPGVGGRSSPASSRSFHRKAIAALHTVMHAHKTNANEGKPWPRITNTPRLSDTHRSGMLVDTALTSQ